VCERGAEGGLVCVCAPFGCWGHHCHAPWWQCARVEMEKSKAGFLKARD
jgi:hypothetical protein